MFDQLAAPTSSAAPPVGLLPLPASKMRGLLDVVITHRVLTAAALHDWILDHHTDAGCMKPNIEDRPQPRQENTFRAPITPSRVLPMSALTSPNVDLPKRSEHDDGRLNISIDITAPLMSKSCAKSNVKRQHMRETVLRSSQDGTPCCFADDPLSDFIIDVRDSRLAAVQWRAHAAGRSTALDWKYENNTDDLAGAVCDGVWFGRDELLSISTLS